MTNTIAGEFFDVVPMKKAKTFRIVVEVPREAASLKAIGDLFGDPSAGNWIALAPLSENAVQKYARDLKANKGSPTGPAQNSPPPANDAKGQDKASPLAQEAGRLCREGGFHEWLKVQHRDSWFAIDNEHPVDRAAWCVCQACKITSRKELDTNPEAAARWQSLKSDYHNSLKVEAQVAAQARG